MKIKYNEFNDGYSQGMFVMARDLEDLILGLEGEEGLTKDELIEMIKEGINSSIYLHVATGGYNASEAGYEVFLKSNKIVNDNVKEIIRQELMKYK